MSHETLTPVPLNPDTAPQHEVVPGEVVEDDRGFVEGALHSQSGKARAESKPSRHKREVVEHIDPENIRLEGATATLAQMMKARGLVQSEEFEAHKPEERDEIISDLLDQLMSDDDESTHAYYRNRLKLGEMLIQSDAKFEKTQRKYELYQARRDEVKLQRPGKHTRAVELDDQENGDVLSTEKVESSSVRKLKREIKKLDREYLGIVGNIAETGTKPAYLESKYAEFKAMISPDNHEINAPRNQQSSQQEAIRKLVQTAVDAKDLEGQERKDYEDHLVSVFHDYVSLSDMDREGIHESLAARYAKANELRSIDKEAGKPVEAEVRESATTRRGARGVLGAMALKIAQSSRRIRTETYGTEEEEQLALFSDEPYKVDSEKSRIKQRTDQLRDGISLLISRNQARRVHKRQLEQARLSSLSDEERELEREKKSDRKAAILLAAGGAAVFAASLYYMRHGLDNPFNGIGSDHVRASSGDALADLPTPPSNSSQAQEVVPGIELDPRGGSVDSSIYPQGASRVDNGEGLFQTFQDMGIPQNEWHDVLRESGPKLVRMGEAYSDPSLGGYGLNGDGKLSYRALDIISEAAKNVK